MKHLRIVIVDDHEVVRLGLRTLLDRHPDFTVVDEAATAKEAIAKSLAAPTRRGRDGHPPAGRQRH